MAFDLARRRAAFGLGAAGLIGASGCAGLATAGSAGPAPDLSTAPGRLRAFMLMRGALDDRLVIGFLSGRYHGVVQEELTPLYGVLSVTFTRYRASGPQASGGYRMATFEHAYYTDVDSGAVLTQWRNPYNGRTVDVPVWSSQPAARTITPDLHFQAGTPMPNMSADHRVLPPERLGDEVVFVERGRYKSDPPPPGRPFRYSELVTLRASAAALGQRDVSRVPCSTAYGAVMSWRPWLQMGDQPGHLMVQGAGAYGAALDAVPAVWLEATRRLRPELIAAPGQRLEALVQAS